MPHPLAKSVSPPLQRHRVLIQQRSTPTPSTSKLAKFQTPRYPEELASRQQGTKQSLQRTSYVDHLTGNNKSDAFTIDIDNKLVGEYR